MECQQAGTLRGERAQKMQRSTELKAHSQATRVASSDCSEIRGDNVLVGHVRWWVRYELSPSALSGLEASAHVCPRCLFVHRMLPGVDESQSVPRTWSSF